MRFRMAGRCLAWIPLLLLVAPAVPAQSSAPTWEWELTPYLWGAGLDGEVKVGRLPASGVEASFSDLWDVLDIGLMAAFEGHREPWGFLVDAFYVELSDSAPAANPAFGEVEVELVQQMYQFAATYRVLEGKTSVDVLGGARWYILQPDLTLNGGPAAGRSVSGDEDWWDGFAGARVRHEINDRWWLTGGADIGAGGSDLSWQLLAGAGCRIGKRSSLKFGYRYLSVDYENGDVLSDMATSGPYVGAGFKF